MDDDAVIEVLVEGFAAEAREICQRLTGHVLALEHAETLDDTTRRKHHEDLARGLHTLKGNADTFGFPKLAELAHRMEDVVATSRGALASLPAEHIDLLLRAIDVFVARLATRRDPAAQPPLDDLLAALTAAGGSIAPAAAPPPRPTPVAPADDPGASALDDWRVGPRHVEALLRDVERLRELRLRLDEQKREIDRWLRDLQYERSQAIADVRGFLTTLSRGLVLDSDEAGDVVDSLEQELTTIATLPVRWALDPLQRLVRDTCRALRKEARLAFVGAEISLDRRVLEALKGPLVHLVRNAIDHGIEHPDQRIAAGKHREGALAIRIERAGNLVFIDVEDDGAGIDPEQIRRQAVARGVLAEQAAATLGERELQQLLFHPGFSTRDAVSEVSGRGVGLDIVRTAVQLLAGHVEVHTKLGSGSRFVLTVPAALGSTPILVVRADEQAFGIPMIAIETIRAARPYDLQAGRTTSRFEHQGALLLLVDLASRLGLRPPQPTAAGQPVLIVASRGLKMALAVDELIGDRDLVVRPLPAELQGLAAYQGAATQARGDLLLVLEPEFLVEAHAAVAEQAALPRALVVDDSLTARALHRTILESGGYQVHTVGGARQALDHLRHAHYDVVIADVMMADVDGIQLTMMVRARRETKALPIILVSAHDTPPDRERGLAAGADAFVSKKDCISGRLLTEIAAAIARRGRVT